MTARDKMVQDLWFKATMGYDDQFVDPAVLEEFAVLIAKKCLALNSETITALKADSTIEVPGSATLFNLAKAECRNRIKAEFNIED